MPARDDALAVRRFAQARRRARETAPPPAAPLPPAAPTDIAGTLAAMDAERREIALLFAQALMQTAAPGMLARGRRCPAYSWPPPHGDVDGPQAACPGNSADSFPPVRGRGGGASCAGTDSSGQAIPAAGAA